MVLQAGCRLSGRKHGRGSVANLGVLQKGDGGWGEDTVGKELSAQVHRPTLESPGSTCKSDTVTLKSVIPAWEDGRGDRRMDSQELMG